MLNRGSHDLHLIFLQILFCVVGNLYVHFYIRKLLNVMLTYDLTPLLVLLKII